MPHYIKLNAHESLALIKDGAESAFTEIHSNTRRALYRYSKPIRETESLFQAVEDFQPRENKANLALAVGSTIELANNITLMDPLFQVSKMTDGINLKF